MKTAFGKKMCDMGKLNLVKGLLMAVCCLACGLPAVYAQEVQLNEDPGAARLFQAWVRENRANPRVSGWRVQLMSTTDRAKIEEAKNRFRLLYPEVPADWVHERPYYKLRAGAFRTRAEAIAFVAAVLKDAYPGAYPAQDANIHPRDFLNH